MEKKPNNKLKTAKRSLQAYLGRFRRWNLLLIRNDGQTISLGNLKVFAAAAIVLLAVATTISFAFIMHSKGVRKENTKIQKALSSSQSEALGLRKEKKALMVRLVLAEAKQQEYKTSTEKKLPQDVFEALSLKGGTQANSDQKLALISGDQKGQPAALKTESKVESKSESIVPVRPKRVDIDEFTIAYDRNSGTVKAKFRIKKIDEKAKNVSGYAFVVLKPNDVLQSEWVTMPVSELVDGRPVQIKKGLSFSISRFKTMRFKKTIIGEFKRFKVATVFVFDKTDQILMQRDVSINM